MQATAKIQKMLYNTDMAYYCFILGRNPIISLAEIFNREAATGAGLQVVDVTSQAVIVKTDGPFDAAAWQQALGGSIKIGRIIQEYASLESLHQALTTDNLLHTIFDQKDKKIVFGFSCYGDLFRRYLAEFNKRGIQLKKGLQQAGYKSRFVAAKESALSSVQVDKNKMIASGADILIIKGIHALYLGKTITIQNFEEYSERDFGRPSRDARSGMLPPKVAKIMINFSRTTSGVLLDPFCGSGTILQEAILMGFTQLIGSDISPKAIHDTRENLDWFKKNFQVTADIQLHQVDVKKLDSLIQPHSVDTIVTEPYLGPTINRTASAIDMLATIQELESLYLAAFRIFSGLLKAHSTVVIIFPLFRTTSGIYALKILEQLEAMGFRRINPLPDNVTLFAKVGPTARGSLIYSRPDQKVEREIFIFKYNK